MELTEPLSKLEPDYSKDAMNFYKEFTFFMEEKLSFREKLLFAKKLI